MMGKLKGVKHKAIFIKTVQRRSSLTREAHD